MTKSLAKAIALATVLGASASAHAMNVNQDGLGQVLLYSLYTTEQGNDTNISITNTSDMVKAVKVRFLEGQNSQEVLDFNLYLSPHDQWSGAITQTANGAKLVTFDRSCTAPAIPAGGVEFRNAQYKNDGGEQSLARTRVGHVEIIEMGDIDPTSTLGALAVHDASKSGAAGTNAQCDKLRAQFSGSGAWASDLLKGFTQSSESGLYGYATVLNVEKSTQISYDALAIDNFRDKVLHTNTGSLFPSLNSGVSTATFKNGTSNLYGNSATAVSALLMKESISNDYVLDEGRLSETNWVVTFPTKRFHVNTIPATQPFVNAWLKNAAEVKAAGELSTAQKSLEIGKACHQVDLLNWDNEEFAGTPADLDFSPAPVGETSSLCYETNILTFNDAKVLGGEFVSYNVNLDQPDFQFGWMNMAFNQDHSTAYELPDFTGAETINGLPVTGFSAVTISNNIADNGVMNNYGSSITHKASTTKDDAPVPQ